MAAGFGLLVLSDTLYSNAGLEGGLFPGCHVAKKTAASRVLTACRIVLGLLGSTAAWSGGYAVLQVRLSVAIHCAQLLLPPQKAGATGAFGGGVIIITAHRVRSAFPVRSSPSLIFFSHH